MYQFSLAIKGLHKVYFFEDSSKLPNEIENLGGHRAI